MTLMRVLLSQVVDATFNMKESLTELSELVGTAGLEVAGSTCQRVHDFNSRTCLGSGKVREIKVRHHSGQRQPADAKRARC